jgi:hypothetical protein
MGVESAKVVNDPALGRIASSRSVVLEAQDRSD